MRHYYHRRRVWNHREFAERHIKEANDFSQLVGGTDKIVKDFFFSLDDTMVDKVFAQYGKLYGDNAKIYAKRTYNEWKSAKRQMSGLVAKRLFAFLPLFMGEKIKFDIAENIWQHYLPSSRLYLVVGIFTPVSNVQDYVKKHLQKYAGEYFIPREITETFKWLAQNDILLLEEMLTYFTDRDIQRAFLNIGNLLPIIQRKAQNGSFQEAECSFTIQNHSISIRVKPKIESGIIEECGYTDETNTGSAILYFGIAVALFFLLYKLFLC